MDMETREAISSCVGKTIAEFNFDDWATGGWLIVIFDDGSDLYLAGNDSYCVGRRGVKVDDEKYHDGSLAQYIGDEIISIVLDEEPDIRNREDSTQELAIETNHGEFKVTFHGKCRDTSKFEITAMSRP